MRFSNFLIVKYFAIPPLLDPPPPPKSKDIRIIRKAAKAGSGNLSGFFPANKISRLVSPFHFISLISSLLL